MWKVSEIVTKVLLVVDQLIRVQQIKVAQVKNQDRL